MHMFIIHCILFSLHKIFFSFLLAPHILFIFQATLKYPLLTEAFLDSLWKLLRGFLLYATSEQHSKHQYTTCHIVLYINISLLDYKAS